MEDTKNTNILEKIKKEILPKQDNLNLVQKDI